MSFKIAVDGPAGAGKSTVARRVALELGLGYLDTGAMYRAVAWRSNLLGVPVQDVEALAKLAGELPIRFSPLARDGSQCVLVDGEEATAAIRTPENSERASVVATIPELRAAVVDRQRSMGNEAERGVVLEGRDIGTVVFPDAQLKVFLTASAEERARRRWEQMVSSGATVDYEEFVRGQRERDARDSERTASPLVVAEGAVTIDTDGMSIDQVVGRIVDLARARMVRDGDE